MNPEHRAKAEKEAADDLAKTPRHLLFDIHDELIRTDRSAGENLVHAQKRLASLHVKNAEASEKITAETKELTRKIHVLTLVIAWLTVAITVITIQSCFK